VFAVFSSAWVVPALVGPAASTGVTSAIGWRAVFLGLLPLVLVAALITLPALTRTPPDGIDGHDPAIALTDGFVLTAGAGLVLVALSLDSLLIAAPLFVIGAAAGTAAFLRLVPPGTVSARAGLPAAVLVRGLLTFSFFGTDAYVSLVFQDQRDQPTWVAGAALTTSTLCWTAAAWTQQRWIHALGPRTLVRTGLAVLAVATAGMFGVLGSLPIPLSIVVWGIGGFGIGLAYSPLSVTVLGLAEPGREGARSASLQLCDVLGVVLGTGIVGVLVAFGDAQEWTMRSSLEIAFALTLAVALVGAMAARRLPDRLPG
jgi:MFS family permease